MYKNHARLLNKDCVLGYEIKLVLAKNIEKILIFHWQKREAKSKIVLKNKEGFGLLLIRLFFSMEGV